MCHVYVVGKVGLKAVSQSLLYYYTILYYYSLDDALCTVNSICLLMISALCAQCLIMIDLWWVHVIH